MLLSKPARDGFYVIKAKKPQTDFCLKAFLIGNYLKRLNTTVNPKLLGGHRKVDFKRACAHFFAIHLAEFQ